MFVNQLGQKLHHIGKPLFQMGIIGASLFSGYLIIGTTLLIPLFFIIPVLGALLGLVLTVIGCLFFIGGGILSKTLTKEIILEVIKSPQLYIIVSIILVTWTLVLIPTMIFTVLFFQPSGIWGGRAFLFPFFGGGVHLFELYQESPFPLNFFVFYLMHPESNGNLFFGVSRLVGIGVVIFTCLYLFQQLRYLFNNWKTLQNSYSLMLIRFEAVFNISLLIYLVLNLVIPLWEFFDPKAYLTAMFFHGLNFFLAPFFSLFLITFLVTGRISRSYLVISNLQRFKLRFFIAIGLALLAGAPYVFIFTFSYF